MMMCRLLIMYIWFSGVIDGVLFSKNLCSLVWLLWLFIIQMSLVFNCVVNGLIRFWSLWYVVGLFLLVKLLVKMIVLG